jgi:hypothetical protein
VPGRRNKVFMSQILKFPDGARYWSNDGLPREAVTEREDRTVTKIRSRHVPVMTGDQWNGFIRLLTPDERQAFMVDVWKIINLYCRRIAGELSE